jgi:phosphate-selective porin OprO/OprP
MDLNYRAGDEGEPPPLGGVRGGDQQILGAALLWYPRPRVRLMINYLHVTVDRLNPAGDVDPEPFGPPPATPPVGVQIGQTLNILAVRARYSF